MVVLGREHHPLGLFMVLAFAALAGIYALLGATLVAAAQVLVYIGAISVLILFAIMLTQSKSGPARLVFHHQAWAAAIAAIVAGPAAHHERASTRRGRWRWPSPSRRAPESRAAAVRRTTCFAFEVVSVLLLAAVIGGVFLARRDAIARVQGEPADDARTPRPTADRGGGGRHEPLARRVPASSPRCCSPSARSASSPRRNAIAMLMSIELMLNAVNLAIVAFGAFTPALQAHASVIALLVMAVAAAEATVGLAIVIAIYRNRRTPLVDEYASMRE